MSSFYTIECDVKSPYISTFIYELGEDVTYTTAAYEALFYTKRKKAAKALKWLFKKLKLSKELQSDFKVTEYKLERVE